MSLKCELCKYESENKYYFTQHLKSKKHLKFYPNEKEYVCEYCEKKIKHQSSYSRHKSKCKKMNEKMNEKIELELIKQELNNVIKDYENKLKIKDLEKKVEVQQKDNKPKEIKKITGCIYRLSSFDGKINYYGMTTRNIYCRLSDHIKSYMSYINKKSKKYCSSFAIFQKYGTDNVDIKILEKHEDIPTSDLLAIETRYINNNECCNIQKKRLLDI